MMEICSSTDDQFYSDKLFEEIETSIQLVQIETQKFEANVYICFEQIQHFGNQLVQSTYNFDEDQYNQIFMQLESYKNELNAINDELMNNILMKWKIRQQELSVGYTNENDIYSQRLLNSLKSIEGCIMQFASVLNRLNLRTNFVLTSLGDHIAHLNAMNNLLDNTNMHILDILNNCQKSIEAHRKFFNDLLGELFKSSIVIYKQPPPIITMFEQRASTKKPKDATKNDGELKKRLSKFWFDTEIRLLGAQFWAQNYAIKISEITCEVLLLTEHNVEQQKFTIKPDKADLDPATFSASFLDMKILKTEKRPRGVKNRRYAILYEMQTTPFGRILKLSLPFAIVSGEPDVEIDTWLFLERFFANLSIQIGIEEERKILGQNPTFDAYHKSLNLKEMSIENDRVIEALELKFRDRFFKEHIRVEKILEERRTVDVQIRSFNQCHRDHLSHMLEQTIPKHLAQKGRVCKCHRCNLKKDGHEIVPGKISLSSILDHIVCMKFVTHEGKLSLVDCTFNEWFYKVAEIADVLKTHWNSGELYGFCDQTVAEAISRPDRILIRFADTMHGQLRLTMKDSNKYQKNQFIEGAKEVPRVRHVTIKYAENIDSVGPDSFNDDRQFFKLIKTAARLYNVYHIYPDFKIDPKILFDEQTTNLDTAGYCTRTYSLANASGISKSSNVAGPYSI